MKGLRPSAPPTADTGRVEWPGSQRGSEAVSCQAPDPRAEVPRKRGGGEFGRRAAQRPGAEKEKGSQRRGLRQEGQLFPAQKPSLPRPSSSMLVSCSQYWPFPGSSIGMVS